MPHDPGSTTAPVPSDGSIGPESQAVAHPALVVCWSQDEPNRVGQVAHLVVPGRAYGLGRGEAPAELPRLCFVEQRPGSFAPAPMLAGQAISREQLRVQARAAGLEVEVVGRCPTFVNGAALEPGDTRTLA